MLARAGGSAPLLALLALAAAACTGTVRVSATPDGAHWSGDAPSVDGTGRFVAFESGAPLVAGDTNGHSDVFVRDMEAGTIERVSVASNGMQGNADSTTPFISRDGRYVAFASLASNLAPNDDNGGSDVFVHDRVTGTTKLLTREADGTSTDGGESQYAFPQGITSDGAKVLFVSNNVELGAPGAAGTAFRVDTATGAIAIVSDQAKCPYPGGNVTGASMTRDGTKVAYGILCYGGNQQYGSPASARLIIRNDNTGHTFTAFRFDHTYEPYDTYLPRPGPFTATRGTVLTFVLFDSIFPHGSTVDGYVFDNGTVQRFDPGESIGDLTVSTDGRYLAYSTPNSFPYAPEVTKIVLLDRASGRRYWVTVTPGNQTGPYLPDGTSQRPVFSDDGSLIAWRSDSTQLVAGTGVFGVNVYARPTALVLQESPRD